MWENFSELSIFPSIIEESNLSKTTEENCILKPISASSTDNYPDKRIEHTLDPRDRGQTGPSYWSSKGEIDPRVLEKITYRLKSNSCVVSEIMIQPLKAFFQLAHPIYSAKAVRFRMGYSIIDEDLSGNEYTNDYYIWTHVSPEFPMKKEDTLQSFKLPRHVVCIGGIVQIELLGRVQKQELGGLFYISMCHVKVIGHELLPLFDCNLLQESMVGPVLKYFQGAMDDTTYGTEEPEFDRPWMSDWEAFTRRRRDLKSYLWLFKIMLSVFRKSS